MTTSTAYDNGQNAPAPQKTCLIVDDSKMIRRIAARILHDMDFATSEAENGQDALSACQANMPDAILLDWTMPVMDGMTFLKSLRTQPRGDHPAVIFCSTIRDVEKISMALDAGADEYVMKPFDSDILRAKFAEAGL